MAHATEVGFAPRFSIKATLSDGTNKTPLQVESLEGVCWWGIQVYNGSGAAAVIIEINDSDDNNLVILAVPPREAVVVDIPYHAGNGVQITPADGALNIALASVSSAIVFHNSPGK